MTVLSKWAAVIQGRCYDADDLYQARFAFVDTYACIFAGLQTDVVRKVKTFAGDHLDASKRALILGTAAHALDYDDYEDLGSTHPSAVIIPTLNALVIGNPKKLDIILQAYLTGYETILMFGKAMGYGHYKRGWHATLSIGCLGAAAAASNLLGLTPQQSQCALAIAMSQAAGLKAQFGTECKPLHCGIAARVGVEAAQLAALDVSASSESGESYLKIYSGTDAPGWAAVMADPPTIKTNPPYKKQWPSCAYTHRITAAALNIRAQYKDIDWATIEHAEIQMPRPYMDVASVRIPQTPDQARFSPPFCATVALTEGQITPQSFTQTLINRTDIRTRMKCFKMTPTELPPHVGDVSPEAPDQLTLTLKNGHHITETVGYLPGGPDHPLTEADILEKYTLCGGDIKKAQHLLKVPLDAPFPINSIPPVSGEHV